MTNTQRKVIDYIKGNATNKSDLGIGFTDAEIKKFEVEENQFFVSLFVEVGSTNDEGTLASIYCRNRVFIFIGKKGKITYYDQNQKQRIGNQYDLFHIYVDQNCK